jgi:hypothetical protein
MQYLAKCDLIVYDLHFGNPRDVETALKALSKPVAEGEERPGETVLILISSLLAWDRTPKKMQEILSPDEARALAAKLAEEKARLEAEEGRELDDEKPKSDKKSDQMSEVLEMSGEHMDDDEMEGMEGKEGMET